MGFGPDALRERRAALEAMGFTCVEHELDSFTAVRCQMMWESGLRMTYVIRVRRVAVVEESEVRAQLGKLQFHAHTLDPSVIPRGLQQGRTIMDVLLVDAPDEAARALARRVVGHMWGGVALVVVAEPDGAWHTARPIWGRAFVPRLHHLCQVIATARPSPEPIGGMALFIGIVAMWPGILIALLGCCGLPLLVPLATVLFEKKPQPAALPPG